MSVTTPMTMPAQAQAIATASVFLRAVHQRLEDVRQLMPSRVDGAQQRDREAGSVPASAQSGAE